LGTDPAHADSLDATAALVKWANQRRGFQYSRYRAQLWKFVVEIAYAALWLGWLRSEQIVKESYAQMRKFNCWNISIVQQYSRFKESSIRSAVFGNSRQFFLMHAILSYPLPDQQSGEKFAAFTYLHSDAQNPICGTVHNVVSPEMLYLSGTSGVQFDERAAKLRGSNDLLSAIAAATVERA
jgi:hypothetical protein